MNPDPMGYSKARKRRSGTRWTAYYDSYDGRVRSAGTFATKEAADLAWLSRESAIGKGAVDDPHP